MATLGITINGVGYDIAPEEPFRSDVPRSGFYAISRSVARSWLHNNRHNRSLSDEAAGAQGRDMSTEDWDVNGETLILSRPLKEGEMEGVPAGMVVVLDGQHRLEACEKSGAPFVTNISWGIDPATRRSIDSGRVRTLRDVLGMDGEKLTGTLSTLLRRQVMWDNGLRKFTGGSKTITKAEMLRLLNKRPQELRRAAELAHWVVARPDGFTLVQPAAVAQAIYLTYQIDESQAAWYFARLRDGAELASGHPILAVRRRFENDLSTSKGIGRRKVAAHQPLGYILRGWNGVRAGETIERMLFTSDMNIPNPK